MMRLQGGTYNASKSCPKHHYRAGRGPIGSARNRWRYRPFNDVVWRVQGSIDPPAPGIYVPVPCRWELEIERLPMGIQDHMNEQSFPSNFQAQCQAVGIIAPVRLFELYSVPGDIGFAEQLVQGLALVFSFQVSQQPSSNE